jgi:hypothetical protein
MEFPNPSPQCPDRGFTLDQPFNLAFGVCGLYCLFIGRFPFLESIGLTVTRRRLESGTNRLGFLNLILTTIVFLGMFVYMGWVGSQGPFH